MEASLDLSRWRTPPRGVGYRRWTIISTGLRQLFQLRFFKILISIAWGGGVALAAAGFLFSQTISTGGLLETFAEKLGPRAQAFGQVVTGLVTLYPDIVVGGTFSLLFWVHSYLGLYLSLIALTAVLPRLITRDRATNALTVYLSRPLTSGDYLLGKLGMITGVLLVVWTGPLLFGWVLSMLFAPDRDFIIYSFEPLGRALLFNAIALVVLAAIALGVSALTRTSRNTLVLWIGLWLVMGAVTVEKQSPLWLQRASFSRNLNEVRQGVLRVDDALTKAGEVLPLTNQRFAESLRNGGKRTATSDFNGALAGLAVFVALSSFVFLRKIRPE